VRETSTAFASASSNVNKALVAQDQCSAARAEQSLSETTTGSTRSSRNKGLSFTLFFTSEARLSVINRFLFSVCARNLLVKRFAVRLTFVYVSHR
jgi:hypothetical protein